MKTSAAFLLVLTLGVTGCAAPDEEPDGFNGGGKGDDIEVTDANDLKDTVWQHIGESFSEYVFYGVTKGGYMATQGQHFPFDTYELTPAIEIPDVIENTIVDENLWIDPIEVESIIETKDSNGDTLTVLFQLQGGCLVDPFNVAEVGAEACFTHAGSLLGDTLESTSWSFATDSRQPVHFGYVFHAENNGGFLTLTIGGIRDTFTFDSYQIIKPEEAWLEATLADLDSEIEADSVKSVVILQDENKQDFSWLFRTSNNCLVDQMQVDVDDCFKK